MGHIVNLVDKEGYLKGHADYSDLCRLEANRIANEWRKHNRLTMVHFLGEERMCIVSDIDELHQRAFVVEEGKGIIGAYLRQKETPDSEWGEWKGGVD